MAKRAGLPIDQFRRRDQRQRRRAGTICDRPLRAAPVGADDRQRDGRRQPEQLRAHAVAVRRRPRGDARATSSAAATRDDEVRDDDPARLRNARIPARSAQRDRVSGDRGAGRAGGAGGPGRSGVFLATAHPAKFAEIVEPIIGQRCRDAGAAGRGARAAAAHPADRRDARGRHGSSRWLTLGDSRAEGRFATARTFSMQLWRHGVQPTERTQPELCTSSSAISIGTRCAAARTAAGEGVSETGVRRSRRRTA